MPEGTGAFGSFRGCFESAIRAEAMKSKKHAIRMIRRNTTMPFGFPFSSAQEMYDSQKGPYKLPPHPKRGHIFLIEHIHPPYMLIRCILLTAAEQRYF